MARGRTIAAAVAAEVAEDHARAGYAAAAIPLAAGALALAGFVLPTSVDAALMSLSTSSVALNAQLLRRVDLRPTPV